MQENIQIVGNLLSVEKKPKGRKKSDRRIFGDRDMILKFA